MTVSERYGASSKVSVQHAASLLSRGNVKYSAVKTSREIVPPHMYLYYLGLFCLDPKVGSRAHLGHALLSPLFLSSSRLDSDQSIVPRAFVGRKPPFEHQQALVPSAPFSSSSSAATAAYRCRWAEQTCALAPAPTTPTRRGGNQHENPVGVPHPPRPAGFNIPVPRPLTRAYPVASKGRGDTD